MIFEFAALSAFEAAAEIRGDALEKVAMSKCACFTHVVLFASNLRRFFSLVVNGEGRPRGGASRAATLWSGKAAGKSSDSRPRRCIAASGACDIPPGASAARIKRFR